MLPARFPAPPAGLWLFLPHWEAVSPEFALLVRGHAERHAGRHCRPQLCIGHTRTAVLRCLRSGLLDGACGAGAVGARPCPGHAVTAFPEWGLGRAGSTLTPPSLQAEAAVAAVAVADSVREGPPTAGPDGTSRLWGRGGAPGSSAGAPTGTSAASFFLR
ncbi:hypothetical protein J0S82_003348 [Galemys pyrenaicus]|uniref:Uncharacterized protein n=1 Tax=Galemys pyrenaicus TaxID=202257 RepID=A0A8J6A8V4_GALPY|nr:hypothetical protein J0S82_003348 [Galemys pyrenaicus]